MGPFCARVSLSVGLIRTATRGTIFLAIRCDSEAQAAVIVFSFSTREAKMESFCFFGFCRAERCHLRARLSQAATLAQIAWKPSNEEVDAGSKDGQEQDRAGESGHRKQGAANNAQPFHLDRDHKEKHDLEARSHACKGHDDGRIEPHAVGEDLIFTRAAEKSTKEQFMRNHREHPAEDEEVHFKLTPSGVQGVANGKDKHDVEHYKQPMDVADIKDPRQETPHLTLKHQIAMEQEVAQKLRLHLDHDPNHHLENGKEFDEAGDAPTREFGF